MAASAAPTSMKVGNVDVFYRTYEIWIWSTECERNGARQRALNAVQCDCAMSNAFNKL